MSGDIQCFSGGHIPLALLAILMLALCVFLIPTLIILAIKVCLLFCCQYAEHVTFVTIMQRPHDIRYWIDPLTAGFKDENKWWSGMELGRRLLFLLFIISFPKNTVSNAYNMLLVCSVCFLYCWVCVCMKSLYG